mgnify:CR=1 FL=1
MDFWDIVLVLMVLFAAVAASYCYYDVKTGVPTFPTLPIVRGKMLAVIQEDMAAKQAKISAGQAYTIIDLGSGSGQLSWHIARALPQAQIVGIELSPVPYFRSVLHQRLFGPSNLSYKKVDFWSYDVSHADAILTYLLGPVMERMSAKLHKELQPGALVLSNKFRMVGWDHAEIMKIPVPFTQNLFVYRQA